MSFGVLRVFNDDVIAPKSGFPDHPHDNYEILTLVFNGELTHEDSTGAKAIIGPGMAQYMSAGSGVEHSEMNNGAVPVELFQLWFEPKEFHTLPQHREADLRKSWQKNILMPVISDNAPSALSFQADATLYLGDFEQGGEFDYTNSSERGVFIYLRSGSLSINGVTYEAGDQVRVTGKEVLKIQTLKDSIFVLIDVLS